MGEPAARQGPPARGVEGIAPLPRPRPRRTAGAGAGAILGFGLGGLADGIVLHQVLRWHHLVSERTPTDTRDGLDANTLADGLFHLVALGLLLVGFWAIERVRDRDEGASGRSVIGGVLIGWGVFNLVDEVLFHLALDLHHIRPGPDELGWDLAFTGVGLALIAIGVLLSGRGGRYPTG